MGSGLRIGAVSDVHLIRNDAREVRRLINDVNDRADVLCVCGDMTTHGTPNQMRAFCGTLRDVECPIVAVLGNHDHHSGQVDELGRILRDRGIHLLDGESVVIGGVGFAGTKGFGGGFGDHCLDSFGEEMNRAYAAEAIDESRKLDAALETLASGPRVALLHYAPIPDTVRNESREIFPFLGSSRLLEPIERHGVDVVFHGHAHRGPVRGSTPSGIPVFNVAYPAIKEAGEICIVWTVQSRHLDG